MPEREIRYCTTEDGVRIAFSVEGEGPVVEIGAGDDSPVSWCSGARFDHWHTDEAGETQDGPLIAYSRYEIALLVGEGLKATC